MTLRRQHLPDPMGLVHIGITKTNLGPPQVQTGLNLNTDGRIVHKIPPPTKKLFAVDSYSESGYWFYLMTSH